MRVQYSVMALAKRKKIVGHILVTVGLIAIAVLAWPANRAEQSPVPPRAVKPTGIASTDQFDKARYPVDEASSIWVVVNKGRALPSNYVPANLVAPAVPLRLPATSPEMHLRADAAAALEQMFTAAKQDSINLMLESGYRSYAEQRVVYGGYVTRSGVAQADTFSARPGHSEHQTGLAADIEPTSRACEVDQCFEDTPEGKWLSANSFRYGFIIRYPKNSQALTGYEYEPWHVRYVGMELAQQLHPSNQTLEQFFDLPVYDNYPTNSYEIKDL